MSLNGMGMGIELGWHDQGAIPGLANFNREFQQAHGTVSRGAPEMGQKMDGLQNSMAQLSAGAAVMGAGLAGLAGLYATTSSASVYSQKVAEISTLTDEATLSYERLYDQVLGLNDVYGGGTAQQAKALYDGISAGAANAAEAQSLLDASNRLSVAGVTEVGVALDGLTSSLNAYGVSFTNASEFSDKMFTAVKKGKTTIAELSGVIGRVAPTASALGVSFGDLNAALAAVTLKGLKTEEAATGLKAAFANIINPTADAEKEAKRLGVSFDAAGLRAKGFPAFLEAITSSAGFNQDSLQKLFSSTEALNSVLALTANGSSAFKGALDAMNSSTGATDAAFAKMSAESAFQEKRFAALVEDGKILIGQVLIPLKAGILEVANAFITKFNNMNPALREFLVKGLAVTSAVVAMVGAAMSARAGFALLSNALGTSFAAMAASAGTALLVIGAVVLAIYGLKYAIDSNLGGIGDMFRSAVAKVTLAFNALVQLFTQGGFSGAVRAEFEKSSNDGIRAFAIQVYMWVSRIGNFLSNLKASFVEVVTKSEPTFARLGAAIGRIGEVFGLVQDGPKKAGSAFDTFGRVGARVGGAIAAVLGIVADYLTTVINFWTGLTSRISSSEFVKPISAAFTLLGESIGTIMTALGGLNVTMSSTGTMAGSIGSFIGGVLVFSIRAAANVVQTLATMLANLATAFSGVMNLVVGLFTGDWSRAWLGAKQIAFGVISAIVDTFGSLVQFVANGLDMLSKVGGNTTNYAGDVAAWRTKTREGMASSFGVDQAGQAEATARPVSNTAVSAISAVPAAMAGYAPQAEGMAGITQAIAEGMAKARSGAAAAPLQVNVMLDSQVLASAMTSAGDDNAGRLYSPQAQEG